MELNQLEEWYNVLVKLRQNELPIIKLNNESLTPDQIMEHARANDSTWQQIEEQYPDLDTEEVNLDLMLERIEEKYKKGLLPTIFSLSRQWSPEEILTEVRKKSSTGLSFLIAEKKFIEEIKKRKLQNSNPECPSCDSEQ